MPRSRTAPLARTRGSASQRERHPQVHQRVVDVDRAGRAVAHQHGGEMDVLVRGDEVDAPGDREIEIVREEGLEQLAECAA